MTAIRQFWSVAAPLALVLLAAAPARAQDAVCAKVKLVIPQKLTFERDAFDAMLTLTNNLSDAALDDLDVRVEIRTLAGDLAEEQFFVTVSSLDGVTGIDGAGVVLPNEMGTIHWLLIPSAGAGGMLPGGVNYRVKATITYTVNGQPFDLETYEETITVKPQPLLVLDYFLPQKVWGDDPFTAELEPVVPYELAVRVSNIGWGPANNLKIETAQPVIVENDQGLLIDFKIIGTWLNGTDIAKSLAILFGNLAAKDCSTGAWAMTSSLQGTFTELSVSFTHKDELGGEKTSLVEATNSHWLVHMVRLDTPGKDAEPDLLAYEIGEPEGVPTIIYESDCGTSPVSVVPAVASGDPSLEDNTASVTATLQSGWCWTRAPDPAAGAYPILKVVRDSDGKVLDPRNAWIHLDEDRDPFVAIFDWSTLGPLEETYTIFYDLSEFDETPPVSVLTFVGPHAGTAPTVVSPFTIINTAATDDMAGVAKREIRKDGGDWAPAAPFFFQAGEHVVEYRATDKKGNVEPTRVAQIVVDGAAPAVGAASPLPGTVHHVGEPLLVEVAVTDLDPAPTVELTLVSADGGATLAVPSNGATMDVSALAPGEYDLLASVTDWMGNHAVEVIGPFTLDEYVPPPPVVTLAGVAGGAHVAAPVVVTASVDPELPVALTLDGQPYDGAPITADGVHVVEGLAIDAWGQEGTAALTFTLDQTAPVVTWSGVTAGQVAGAPVSPTLTVLEPNLASQAVTLDGAPFTSGAQVAAEGPHAVAATVTDLAGNETSASVAFTVDLTPPAITIEGIDDGAAYAAPVAPTVTVTDLTLTESSVTLDGQPYLSGTPIDAEGPHTLAVTAQDAVGRTAGQSVSFLVDTTPPAVDVAGVEDGGSYADPVAPVVTFDDANLATSAITLDGAPFESGAEVGDAGEHTLVASATDVAGNTTEVTVTFTIDLDAPSITVAGVAPGAFYAGPVTPVVTVQDDDLDTVVVTLDGAPFESGTEIAAEGAHMLRVVATDTAGNTAIKPISFTIDATAPVIAITGVADGAVYGAPVVPAGTVTDATAVVVTRTLDGAPFTSGTAVAAEGPHVFAVTAVDKAGNEASASVAFTVDLTAPAITLAGVADGEWAAVPVAVTATVQDATEASLALTLDGAPYEAGASIAAEGPHTITATATDAAGNEGTASVTFGVDLTAPVVALTGVADGALYGQPVAVGWTVDEANPGAVVATLDGAPVVDGQAVAAEGTHTLAVTATDLAGNEGAASATFTLDLTAPVVTLADIGEVVHGPVELQVQVSDPGATVAVTLDDAPWDPADPIEEEGPHTVTVTATDAAGNVGEATAAFTIDATAPVISIDGVADGGIYGAAVTPTFTVADATELVVGALLDGEPFTSGTPVGEGAHVLFVQATDAAGNEASAEVAFTVDLSAPALAIGGVDDGAWYAGPVTPTVETDAGAPEIAATLDGAPWTPGTEVAAEGWHTLAVTVTDAAGNAAKTTVEFGIDVTPPALAIGGVSEGAVVPAATPTVTATDEHLVSLEITLDGAPFTPGTPVTEPGPHTLAVSAADIAGNEAQASVTFVVDPSAPLVTLVGVEDGGVYGGPVTLDATAESISSVTLALTVDGEPFAAGGTVDAEGPHTVVATATSETGATGTASASFVLDLTAPAIAVTGVEDGGLYPGAVTPAWQVTDATATEVAATLDGAPFEAPFGAEVAEPGEHTLVVTATDAAGNEATATVVFTIDPAAPAVELVGVEDGAHYAQAVVLDVAAEGAASTALTLDGQPVEPGVVVETEGEHVAQATATSAAGVSGSATAMFVIDMTAPEVTIDGVAEGGLYGPGVTPTWTVVDAWPTQVTATLDGAPATSGAAVEADGAHTLRVEATDPAGNGTIAEVHFTVDAGPPTVALAGVEDGAVVKGPVAVTVELSAGATVALTLDGAPYEAGAPIAAEGPHAVVAVATSPAGLTAEDAVSFAIDTTPPVVTLGGVVDGGEYDGPVTPTVTVDDAHPGTLVATLDGAPYESGAAVSAPGAHALHAEATDLAGNVGVADVAFTIAEPPPGPLVVRVTKGGAPVAGARVLLLGADGAWLGLQGTLDAGGQWSVTPPAPGEVRMRVDRLWRRFLSPAASWPEADELVVDLPDEPAFAHALHVRSDAGTSGDGSAAKPFRTIGAALAVASFDTLVRVAGGVYPESVAIPEGVAVEGGYDPDSWTLAPERAPTVIEGAGADPAVRFDGAFHGELAHVTVRGGGGLAIAGSPLVRSVIVEECSRADGACVDVDGDLATVVNLLATGNAAPVAVRVRGAAPHVWNATVADNAGVGLRVEGAGVLVERAIVARNEAVGVTGDGGARLEQSLVWGNGGGVQGAVAAPGLLEADPAFVTGALHAHYLSQLTAGDPVDSPALDAGALTAEELELAATTTATSGAGDEGLVDLGFHAWPVAPPTPGGDVGGEDAGGTDAGVADAGGTDAGVDAGGQPDGESGADTASAGDAGPDAAGEPGTDGCGSCTQGPGAPVPPGGAALLALLLMGLLGLRRWGAAGAAGRSR